MVVTLARTSIKHGVFDGKIAFTGTITTGDTITLIGQDIQKPRTLADLEEPLFSANDDGLNVHRESVVMYRVARAAAATMGREGRLQARDLYYECERLERDIAAASDNLMSGEIQTAVGFGPRSDHV